MLYDFNEEMKHSDEVEVTVKGNVYPGILIQARVDPKTIPEEYHTYHLREWDTDYPDDGPCACEIKNGHILVNYFGIFCTKEELPLKEGESFEYEDGLDISFN